MPDLRGQLGFMPCQDVFRYLGNRRLSGTLTASKGAVEKKVVIHEGSAVSAASTDPREYLGQLLINGGFLSEEQFNQAYQTQLATKVPMGQILTMIGLVPEEMIQKALEVKVRETALDICDWRSGTFEFSAHAPTLRGGVPYAIPLLDLCVEADQRARAWIAFRKVLPDGDTRIELVPGRAPPVPRGSLDERLFSLLEGGCTIDELLLSLHSTEYPLYRRLYALVQEGIVAVRREGAEAAAQPEAWFPEQTPVPRREAPAPIAELLARARAALAAGSFDEATEVASRILDRGGEPLAVEVLKEAEGARLAELKKKLLSEKRVPLLLVDRGQIRGMPLSPPERYLLSRIDGARELGAIVRVSPLRELDALRLVDRFLSQGMIRFT